jgi:hypothetical protein
MKYNIIIEDKKKNNMDELNEMGEEVWATIEGYEGYEVSTYGRVQSYWKPALKVGCVLHPEPQRILKGFINRKGRHMVQLWKQDKEKKFEVHRLVAIYFIPNPNNYPQVDHIDRNPLNNHISNLRWATIRQNILNQGIQSNNTSGHKGVGLCSTGKQWRARWFQDGKEKSKSFETKEEAIEHRKKMVEEHYDMDFYTEK